MAKDKHLVNILGVSLDGFSGSPAVVLQCSDTQKFLPLETDPFEIDVLIRDTLGEGENSAVAWIAEMIIRHRCRVCLTRGSGKTTVVRFSLSRFFRKSIRYLPLGEGLVVSRRLNLPLTADDELFQLQDIASTWLANHAAFRNNFLFLSRPNSNAPFVFDHSPLH